MWEIDLIQILNLLAKILEKTGRKDLKVALKVKIDPFITIPCKLNIFCWVFLIYAAIAQFNQVFGETDH